MHTTVRPDPEHESIRELVILHAEDPTGWRVHGLGLLQKYVDDDTRIHIWIPELCTFEESESTHNHRFDLESHVIYGSVSQVDVTLTPDLDGSHERIEFIQADSDMLTRRTREFYDLSEQTTVVPAGSVYEFPRGHYHRSVTQGMVVTVIRMKNKSGTSSALFPRGTTPRHGHASPPAPSDVQAILDRVRDEIQMDIYRTQHSRAGKLKFKALTLLADVATNDATLDAAVLLHEAARIEYHCLSLLSNPSVETRVDAFLEICGCLVDAGDPIGSQIVWGRVIEESRALMSETVEALCSKLKPRYDRLQRRFRQALEQSNVFQQDPLSGWLILADTSNREMGAEWRRLTEQFPGCPELWLRRSQSAREDGRLDDAQTSLEMAQRLRHLSPTI